MEENVNIDEVILKMDKRSKASFVMNIVTLSIASIMFIMFIVAFIVAGSTYSRIKPSLEALEQIDFENLEKTIDVVNNTFEDVDWNKLTNTIENFDPEKIQDLFDKFDVDSLNTAIDNINTTTKVLQDVGEKLKPLLSIFGGGN